MSNLAQQAAVVNGIEPKLGIYPTANDYESVWKVAKFSTNPFGLYMTSVDAHTGEIVARKDFVDFQQAPGALPFAADIYPKYPTITDEPKDQSIISNCGGVPCGQERVTLRGFDQQNDRDRTDGNAHGNSRARQQRARDKAAVRASRTRNVAFPLG